MADTLNKRLPEFEDEQQRRNLSGFAKDEPASTSADDLRRMSEELPITV